MGNKDEKDPSASANFQVSPADRFYYDFVFGVLNPEDGKLKVADMRKLLDKLSLLPESTVNKIINLSDEDGDGLLDKHEFTVGANLVIRAVCGEQQVSILNIFKTS